MNPRMLNSLFILFATVILGICIWLTLRDPVVRQGFWPGFWSNFWSTFVAGSILAPIIIEIYRRTKRLETRMIAAHAEAELVKNEEPLGQSKRGVHFSVWNRFGKFEGVYWHVFVEDKHYLRSEAPLSDCVLKSDKKTISIKGKAFRHIRGRLSSPVYVGTYTEVVYIILKAEANEEVDIYYYLSTAEGIFPKSVRRDKRGHLIPDTFAKVDMFDEIEM